MLAVALLPLLLVPSALASPVTSETRAITLSGSPVKELFPSGHFNEDIAKRECAFTQEKYLRRAEHEKAVSGRKHRKTKRGVATVDILNYGAADQVVSAFALRRLVELGQLGNPTRPLTFTLLAFLSMSVVLPSVPLLKLCVSLALYFVQRSPS